MLLAAGLISSRQIVQELRGRFDPGNPQPIPRASAGDVQQMAFGVVDLFQVCIIRYGFDAFLQRDHFIVASHHGYPTKFQTLCKVHRADGNVTGRRLCAVVQHLERQARRGKRTAGTVVFRWGAHENAQFVRQNSILDALPQPRISTNCAAPVFGWVSSVRRSAHW